MDCATLSTPRMTAYFRAFGQWLGENVGEQKAAMAVHRYVTFFMEIEHRWKAIPNYETLLTHFGAAGLRRVLLPMRWMEESGIAFPDPKAKLEDSERRRIVAMLDKFRGGSPERAILDSYYEARLEAMNDGKTTPRSVRLALSPAASLVLQASAMGSVPPDQHALDAYLKKAPGQRAAVSGFVKYLREVHNSEIILPKGKIGDAQKARRRKLEEEVLALMLEDGEREGFTRSWFSIGLAYFHGLPKNVGQAIRMEQIITDDGGKGFYVNWNDQVYWVPGHGGVLV